MNLRAPILTTKLPFHEWSIIILFCLILLALAGFALIGRKHFSTPPPQYREEPLSYIQTTIKGAVAKPGSYQMAYHSTLKELIEQAQPLSIADLSHVKWKRRLENGQNIHIPAKKTITINVEGMVQEPGPLKILSGTRISEIVDSIKVLPEADLKALRKRKSFLREGDILTIPSSKSTRN